MEKNQVLEKIGNIVDTVRQKNPLIDCITNVVTVNDCANILLAFGASPAMCDVFDEVYNFVQISNALYINIGTCNREQEGAIIQAILAAKQANIPIVLDPVGCAAIPKRLAMIDYFFNIAKIDLVKGNMGEIMALAGLKAEVKGVDSNGDIYGIEEASKKVSKKYGCIVAATGKEDVVTDGDILMRVCNGTELLTKITGAGCMAGALCAATCTVASNIGTDIFTAAIAGIMSIGIAGEEAAGKTKLPGSYRVALMDSIYTLTGKTIIEKGKLQC